MMHKIISLVIWQLLLATTKIIFSQTPPPLAPEVWSEPIRLDILGIGGQPSVSPQGDTIVFYNGGVGIQMSWKKDDLWQAPQPLSRQFNFGLARTPSLSSDRRKIFFSDYGREGGYGAWDLWVSEWSDSLNDWSEAKNLGVNINTDDFELFCFTPDNKHLYFGRRGGEILLVSQWDDTLKQWGLPSTLDNFRLSEGLFVNGIALPANRKKIYLGRWVDTRKHVEFELLVSYFDSTTGGFGSPRALNVNSHPPASYPWYNPGNLGYDAYPAVTADGKFLFFESNRGADSTGNNVREIYFSRLLVDEKGDSVTSVDEDFEPTPQQFELLPNFPNPFNPQTTLRFTLEHKAYVIIRIYDSLGKEVRMLANKFYFSGQHDVVWDGKDEKGQSISSGVYFYQLSADGQSRLKKLMLIH